MKKIIIIAILSALLISVRADCSANDYVAGSAGIHAFDGTKTECVASCQQGYKPSATPHLTDNTASVTCVPCDAGTTSTAAFTATTCTACPAGFYCPAASATGVTPDHPPTPCGDGKYSTASATTSAGCLAITGTGITGCSSYTAADGATCAVAKQGYIPLASASATVTPCLTNCKACTAAAYAGCTTAADGYFQDTATSTIIACIANCKVCTGNTAALCTTANDGFFLNAGATTTIDACAAGCKMCTFNTAAATKNDCTAVAAGYSLSTAKQPVMCAAGKGSTDGNTSADCTVCTAAKNCATCSTPDLCKTCKGNFTFDAAASTCTAFTGTKHGSCSEAAGDKIDQCQACVADQHRELEWDTSVSPPVYKAIGKCVCKAMYYDKSTATPAEWVCAKCPDNAASCTWTVAGGVDNVKCATGFILAGKMICAKPDAASTPTGFALDTSVTPNVFKACFASCTACTGVLATQCTACADKDAKYVAPTSTDAAYAQAFVGAKRGLINNTCFDACPAGFAADSARTGCVAASSSSTGVFAIFALIASLFIIF